MPKVIRAFKQGYLIMKSIQPKYESYQERLKDKVCLTCIEKGWLTIDEVVSMSLQGFNNLHDTVIQMEISVYHLTPREAITFNQSKFKEFISNALKPKHNTFFNRPEQQTEQDSDSEFDDIREYKQNNATPFG
jgi:hypothetical protein